MFKKKAHHKQDVPVPSLPGKFIAESVNVKCIDLKWHNM